MPLGNLLNNRKRTSQQPDEQATPTAQADAGFEPSDQHTTTNEQAPATGSGPNFTRKAEREDVVWAYRLLLGREPENAEVVEQRLRHDYSLGALQTDFFSCTEFIQQHSALGYYLVARSHAGQPKPVMMELDSGLRLWFDLFDYWVADGVLGDRFEVEERAFVRGLLKPGQTVIDIGANIGLYTLSMATQLGPNGRVYAFEPLQHNIDLLHRSIQENKLVERITVEQVALGTGSGAAEMVIPHVNTNSGGAYMLPVGSAAPEAASFERVPVRPLDSYTFTDPIAFIKIDIEGAEPLVLRGARELLRRDRPVILAEINPVQLDIVSQTTPEQWIAEMAALGYGCYTLHEGALANKITTHAGYDLISVVFVPDGQLI